MFAEASKIVAVVLGVSSFIGLTTYYSINKDTASIIRRSIRALSQNRYFRYEHLIYLVVKAGQKRSQLLALTAISYLIHLIFNFLGV